MTNHPIHATWNGPIIMLGFGSIGRGSLPLILRHIACDESQITIIDPSAENKWIAEKEGIAFVQPAITRANYKKF